MSEKDKQQSGKPGRPKDVEILGRTTNDPQRDGVNIVGAAPRHGQTEIYDRSRGEQPTVEIRTHVENTVESDRMRSKPPQPGDAQVRVRNISKESQEEWQRVKEGKDE